MTRVTYKESGVDVKAADRLVADYAVLARSAATEHVLAGIGGFAGFLTLPEGYRQPVLAACTDGVGTKLRLLIDAHQPRTAGMDAAAMCLNDLATCGARPLFMLDYLAVGKLDAQTAREVVAGFADYCRLAGCALLGGETAEMPGFYPPGDFDVAGFAVGVVERDKLVDGSRCQPGDVLIGLASSGAHSNGFALLRWLLDRGEIEPTAEVRGAMLAPTRLYLPLVAELLQGVEVRAMAHITGGGLPGNVARTIPKTLDVVINSKNWPLPQLFAVVAQVVDRDEMFATFNMGIGYTLVVPADQVEQALAICQRYQVEAWTIGRLETGSGRVRIDG